ncbi:hypothetical protein [Xanthobacter autotrophicus]|uniref:hypothetical protein n=1 Tax=Xanthobacter autotrophicus TaxID=280 RepID=UPI00372653C5
MIFSRADSDLSIIGMNLIEDQKAADVHFALFDGKNEDPVILTIRIEGVTSPDLNAVAAAAWRRLAQFLSGWQKSADLKSRPA